MTKHEHPHKPIYNPLYGTRLTPINGKRLKSQNQLRALRATKKDQPHLFHYPLYLYCLLSPVLSPHWCMSTVFDHAHSITVTVTLLHSLTRQLDRDRDYNQPFLSIEQHEWTPLQTIHTLY